MKSRLTVYILASHAAILTSFQIVQADPIFENSVVSNDIDFIRTDDPSTPFEIKDKGRSRKEMPDKRNDQLFLDDVFVLEIQYQDGARVEVWASPSLGEGKVAGRHAKDIASALAKQPKPLREKLSHVIVHSGDETAFAEEAAHFIVLYSRNIERRLSTHDLEETLFHETIHATLEAKHAGNQAWLKAQKKDPGFITAYAARNPKKEDLPESALFAYTLLKHPQRMPAEVEAAVRKLMPNRLRYLETLFNEMDQIAAPPKQVPAGGD